MQIVAAGAAAKLALFLKASLATPAVAPAVTPLELRLVPALLAELAFRCLNPADK